TPAGEYLLDHAACEGCGACQVVCPADAVSSRDSVNGKWFVSGTRFGPMAHAILGYAEENSGRLVTLVRNLATDLASGQAGNPETPDSLSGRIIIDGSPGTGCPVIASVSGANFAVVVTEPTVSGLHDLVRVFDLTRHFRVATGVIVNKADLNEEMTERIRTATLEAGARFLGTVPYDAAFTRAQIRRQTLLEQGDGPAAQAVREIWEEIADSR
ncbi:MAG: 4Fe-4S binding protein, partial [Proteobacteria bacterium]|nr:4Fe-4S binding protein [Pseudomonadota bacterium]